MTDPGPAPEVPAEAPAPRRFGSLPRAIVIALLALIAIVTTVGVTAYALLNRSPHWWLSIDPLDTETVQLAEQVERGLVSTIHKGRPADETWTVAVSAEAANAWLNIKLPHWMANQGAAWPPRLKEVQVHFATDAIAMGARIRGPDRDRIVAATVHPEIDEQGQFWIRSLAAQAGQLDLPSGWTISQLRAWMPDEIHKRLPADQLLDALAGEAPLFPEAIIKLNDGRRVRVLDVRVEEGRLLMTLQSLSPMTRADD
jgi:hypothetical protein